METELPKITVDAVSTVTAALHQNDSVTYEAESFTPTSSDEKKILKRRHNALGVSSEPLLEDGRLPDGWKRLVVQRQSGASLGKYDVYIVSPSQRKFRSRKELGTFLDQSESDLLAADFDFSVFGKDLAKNVKEDFSLRKPKPPKPAAVKQYKASTKKKVESPLNKPVKHDRLVCKQVSDSVISDNPSSSAITINRSAKWTPPRSPYNLIQENLFHNPWQLLVATILLNKSTAKTASPVIYEMLRRWPTPEAMDDANEEELVLMIRPLGLHKKRARSIKKFSAQFKSRTWSYPNELYGIGKYGNDSYRMFCVEEWRAVRPTDTMLTMYWNWLANNWRALEDNRNNSSQFATTAREEKEAVS